MKNLFSPASNGQTLVEAVVVIGVVVLLVTGLIAGTTSSLRSAASGKIRSQAVRFTQEGIEHMRALRDENWTNFQINSGTYCYGSDGVLIATATETCAPNIVTTEGSFIRMITFSWQDPRMVVMVRVSYPEGEGIKNVEFTTYFTKWR